LVQETASENQPNNPGRPSNFGEGRKKVILQKSLLGKGRTVKAQPSKNAPGKFHKMKRPWLGKNRNQKPTKEGLHNVWDGSLLKKQSRDENHKGKNRNDSKDNKKKNNLWRGKRDSATASWDIQKEGYLGPNIVEKKKKKEKVQLRSVCKKVCRPYTCVKKPMGKGTKERRGRPQME